MAVYRAESNRLNCFAIFDLKYNKGSASESGDLATAFFYLYPERRRGMMLPGGVAVIAFSLKWSRGLVHRVLSP